MTSKGFVKFLPYLILIVLMVGLQVVAQRQVNQRNPAAAAANPQMQTVTKVMPFMFGIFGWGFQAGLTLYWTTSSGLRILQQWALYRFDPTLAESVRQKQADLARDAATGKRPDKKAKGGPDPTRPKAKPASGAGREARANGAKPQNKPKAQKGLGAGGAGKAGKPTSGGQPANKAPTKPERSTAGRSGGKPAAKPALGGSPAPVADGASTSNGSTAGAPRPNPGRQQPKKRRKGR